jgi:hypothetical protein
MYSTGATEVEAEPLCLKDRQMNRAEAEQHAEEWIRDWCARDIERIVSHYAEDARFVSPVAARWTGNPLVVGREALLNYWSGARQYGSFRFTLERVLWDDAKQEMVVVYTRDIDDRHERACELFRFDDHGRVIAGEAMYGAEGI